MRRDIQLLASTKALGSRLESPRTSPVDPRTGMARGLGRSSGEPPGRGDKGCGSPCPFSRGAGRQEAARDFQ